MLSFRVFYILAFMYSALGCKKIDSSNDFAQDCSSVEKLNVTRIEVNPYPIKIGREVTIEAEAYAFEDILPGASALITVSMGFFPMYKGNIDLCEEVPKYGIDCPVKKGPVSLTTKLDVPIGIPFGIYKVDVDAKTVDGKELSKLEFTVRIF